jgi:hypothetical protein
MKRNKIVSLKLTSAATIAAIVIFALCGSAYSQPNEGEMVLYIQQTPVEGGTVNPGVGVHRFGPNSEVTLTAVPNPGYQFVYWLGDVSDTTANNTVAYLNAPKIIVAVFERARYEFLAREEGAQSSPKGGLFGSADDYSNEPLGGDGARRPHKVRGPSEPTPPKEEEKPGDFPVPKEGNDFPVPQPIPEPATAALLAVGALMTFAKRKNQKINCTETIK